MEPRPAILVLTREALKTAERIKTLWPDTELHGPHDIVFDFDEIFTDAKGHLQDLFAANIPIIALFSTGIVIRCLAPLLKDKHNEPPVLCVAPNGQAVVPLLGGHHGANEMARRLAELLEISASITTASDAAYGVSLDDPPEGWSLANPESAKKITKKLLNGKSLRVCGKADWLELSHLPVSLVSDPNEADILVNTEDLVPAEEQIVYHPRSLAIGVGTVRGCSPDELMTLVADTLKENNLSPHAVGAIVSVDVKTDELAVHELARIYSLKPRFFSADTLNQQASRLVNPSDVVMAEVGCPGVAEGAALAAVGATGELVVTKTKSTNATCAIGLSKTPLKSPEIGKGRGKLMVIGFGPGDRTSRTMEMKHGLREADIVVGYHLYLDLIRDLVHSKSLKAYELGQEKERVIYALEQAGQGRNVALVCSGDAGIYAMASLVFEILDSSQDEMLSPEAKRAEINVVPGISAFQAAAARIGAPIGHDFCAISLSDLLTPWEVIEKRIRAAAMGDFVIAFYNPRSKKRQKQIEEALSILSDYRPSTTPVLIASNIGRQDESFVLQDLSGFDATRVDMLSLVLVGSSTTRRMKSGDKRDWIYTPRDYQIDRIATA